MSTIAEKLKGLADKIPGYKGYADKESRRAADKELRDATSAAFSSQVTRITRVQEQLINNGDFSTVEQLDRVIGRLQHLADRIRTASYGFTGFFDDDVVDEVVLDRLYAFDLEMANGVEKVGDLIAKMGHSSSGDSVAALSELLDRLHSSFDQRAHLINTFNEPSASDDEGVSAYVETPVGEGDTSWSSSLDAVNEAAPPDQANPAPDGGDKFAALNRDFTTPVDPDADASDGGDTSWTISTDPDSER
ncbi:MAG: hypothetical protein KDD73_03485 [Anaerolineales bacterium]|nr:hypothetical protein [Anaerolineales bacterium]MCB9126583.1 hypothetical protein [Ardenticatenales bacterium]MCB9172491.1 hypothetical protein [Ardenticatenales bacterium]